MHLEAVFPGIKASAKIVAEYIEAHAASTVVPGLEGSLYTTIAVVIGAWNLAHEDRDFKASLSVVFTVKHPGDDGTEETKVPHIRWSDRRREGPLGFNTSPTCQAQVDQNGAHLKGPSSQEP
jgi:hypothetical protein